MKTMIKRWGAGVSAAVSMSLVSMVAGCSAANTVGYAPQSQQTQATFSAALKTDAVMTVMNAVADWQIAQYDTKTNMLYQDETADGHPQGWVYAALFAGMTRHAVLAESPKYLDFLRNVAERNQYLFAPRIYNADDYAIGQMYLDLYELDEDPRYLAPLKMIMELMLLNRSTVSLEFVKAKGMFEFYDGREYSIVPCKNRWCWADALFMGPPVWAHMASVTGDDRYMAFADEEFWATTDYLYDTEEHLYFRDSRFFEQRESNGAKIFWGRGNGWVLAGLARMLEHIPADHPKRNEYETIFREMSAALVKAQTDEGYWRTSILAPQTYSTPETSGTAFITFGLAWGVNHGLLDKSVYMPAIEKGWQGLLNAVHANGKLGWVQQVAHAPGSATYDDTQLYGVGAFLMAGSEIMMLAN